MSPKTILIFSVAYMGCVILLHIFGKITSIKNKGANPMEEEPIIPGGPADDDMPPPGGDEL